VDWIWGITMTKKGIVKWFSNVKGYGFIEYDETEEIFVHFTGIQMDGYRTLKAGQAVEFEAVEGARGLQATNVVLLPEEAQSNAEEDE
jgi:CspA family cold shock protein